MFARLLTLILLTALVGCVTVEPKSAAGLRAGIEDSLRISRPAGAGPFPAVVVLHGANEPVWRDGYADWMDWIVGQGYVAAFFNSASARGISANAMMGPGLMPSERAADVFLVMDILRSEAFVDADRMALIGMSHGGDTALDALVQAPPAGPLKGVDRVPAKGLDGLKAVAAFYPGCHAPVFGVRVTEVHDRNWIQAIPVAFFQGGNDSIIDETLCRAVFDRQKAAGMPVVYHHYAAAPHCFDADYGSDPACRKDPSAAADARAKVAALLQDAFR